MVFVQLLKGLNVKFKLVKGVGNYSQGTACVMSAAVAYKRCLAGMDIGKATDELDCVCPVIRSFLININDSAIWSNDLHRTNVLFPLIPRIVDTNNPELLLKRMFFLVNWAVKTIAPLILRERGFENHAVTFESLGDIVDHESVNAANVAVAGIYGAVAFAAYNAIGAAAVACTGTWVGDATRSATCSATIIKRAYTVASEDLKEKIVVELITILDQLLDVK